MTFRYFFALCLLWAATAGLQGCGGGGAAQGISGPPPVVSAGVYTGSVSQRSFVGALTSAHFYGIHFNSITSAPDDIYDGMVAGVDTTKAEVTTLNFYKNTEAKSYTVSAKITPFNSTQLSIELTQPATTPLSFTATPNALQAADINNVATNWTGKFSYGLGSPTNFSVAVNSAGDISSGSVFGQNSDCHIKAGSKLTVANSNASFFNLNLLIEKTNCPQFSDQTLSGVAFVLLNPESGVAKRMIWVASTPSGQGISFKADR